MPAPTAILIGLRASGKSTIAAALAKRLNTSATDLDDRVAQHLNEPHAGDALNKHGLKAFRRAETKQLAKALTEPAILALGGGTPTAPNAEPMLRESPAPIIYLRLQPESLAKRLAASAGNRPSLTSLDPAAEITALFKQRDPLYRTLATTTIECDQLDELQTLEAVFDALKPLTAQ